MTTALYADLSRYYDLLCADIDYREQSEHVQRLHRLFGNGGERYLDLGCGTGPHLRHFIDFGYRGCGLDLNQPMLDIARQRCPQASFIQGDMASLSASAAFDLVTCFLYSIHYNQSIADLQRCFAAVHAALSAGGLFCFNAVDKSAIDNRDDVRTALAHEGSQFVFGSGWFYAGQGDRQQLRIRIEKRSDDGTEIWQEQHAMVAVTFAQLQALLTPLFEVQLFEHRYDRIEAWDGRSGNALFVCSKH